MSWKDILKKIKQLENLRIENDKITTSKRKGKGSK